MKPEPFRDCTPGGAVDLCSEAIGTRTAPGNAGWPVWEQDPPEGGVLPPGLRLLSAQEEGCQRCPQPFPSLPNTAAALALGVLCSGHTWPDRLSAPSSGPWDRS